MQGCREHRVKLAWQAFLGPWVPEDNLVLLAHLGQPLGLDL